MIDFHTHILPGMDDGAVDEEESIEMLRLSKSQGISALVATSHFYAVEESPDEYLARREQAYNRLKAAMEAFPGENFPRIYLGAEVLFFPGMADVSSLKKLTMGSTPTILVEMPMEPWDNSMLTEVSYMASNLKLLPILAHVDRYMDYLEDDTLLNKGLERNFLIQVNTSYFLRKESAGQAINDLKQGKIHLIGSDCHNLTTRASNFNAFAAVVNKYGCARELATLTEKQMKFLT